LTIDWRAYHCKSFYDELFAAPGQPRPAARALTEYLDDLSDEDLTQRRNAAEIAIKTLGITFTVYSEGQTIDRAWPFDILPRIIPRSVLAKSKNFRPQCVGMKPALGIWAHICGSDLVRDSDDTLYVLEDNLRVPSGVSYMLENRMVTKRVFPELFETINIRLIDDYPAQLYYTLAEMTPRPGEQPVIALLTPDIYNSAYFRTRLSGAADGYRAGGRLRPGSV